MNQYIEALIKSNLPDPGKYPAKVVEAMNYAMTTGGKRLRPTLLLYSFSACAESFGENRGVDSELDNRVVDLFMVAIEMIHTHSLIHDDLPALDNDSLRRGMPTVHTKYDEATAILAGDALLNYAYETALRSFEYVSSDKVPAEHRAELADRIAWSLEVLANKTGINGMLGGQSLDVERSGQALTSEEREYINLKKTCALIEAPLMIGGILAGATKQEVAELETAGESIGMAFQVQDDILDVTSTEEELGKEVNQDARNNKNTFVAEFGVEHAKEYVALKTDRAVNTLQCLFPNEGPEVFDLIELVKALAGRKA